MDAVDVALTNERNGYSAFDADYTPSPEAIAKVNRVFDYIEEFPEKWDQQFFGNSSSETNCFMGLVCRLSGITGNVYDTSLGNVEVGYLLSQAMDILGMGSDEYGDRASYIALFTENPARNYNEPNLDDMRERVSIALNHDFRKSGNNVVITDEDDPVLTN